MTIKDLLTANEHLEYIQGVEEKLLKRKYTGRLGLWVGVAGAVLEVIAELFQTGLLTKLIDGSLWRGIGEPSPLSLIGFILLVLGLGAWFLLRHTKLLLKETREPFRYTFWVKPFERIGGQVASKLTSEDIFHPHDSYLSDLLSHDLMERLNRRIKRLSLLEVTALEGHSGKYRAHILVEGHYTVRQTKTGLTLQLMPRVSIGGGHSTQHLTHQVNFPLKNSDGPKLEPKGYEQIVERVYSRLSTEIYSQIQSDLKEKIKLFPTSYLRASALAVEAEDFAHSNTIDAYGHAINLYESALRYFRVATFTHFNRFMLWLPFTWASTRFHHKLARIRTGYAKSVLYKWFISTTSGRKRSSIHAIPAELGEVISMLARTHNRICKRQWRLTVPHSASPQPGSQPPPWLAVNRKNHTLAALSFPKDNWPRRLFVKPTLEVFKRQQKVMFDAYIFSAIAYWLLGDMGAAKAMLRNAEAVEPTDKDTDSLYLLAAGILEPREDRKSLLFRKATEADPNFEIAQFMLAASLDNHFKNQNHLDAERAKMVLNEYRKTLGINYGNLSAISAMAYLHWLLGNHQEALALFEEGLEFKTLFRQIYSAEIYYGLARIYAEGKTLPVAGQNGFSEKELSEIHQSQVVMANEYYGQALTLDPALGVSFLGASQSTTDYYQNISQAILERYAAFHENVKSNLALEAEKGKAQAEKTGRKSIKNSIYSYALNDYANAAYNYYLRFGTNHIDKAEELYRKAIDYHPTNRVAPFGLGQILAERYRTVDALKAIQTTVKLNNEWEQAILELLRINLKQTRTDLKAALDKAEKLKNEEGGAENLRKHPAANPAAGSPLTGLPTKGGIQEAPPSDTRQEPESLDTALRNTHTKNENALNQTIESLKTFFKGSNLSPLFNSEKSLDEAILYFLKSKPEVNRLHEEDVRLLFYYCEILLHKVCEDNFKNGLDIYRSLTQSFVFNDFNFGNSFYEVINYRQQWLALNGKQEDQELKTLQEKINENLRNTVKNWLESDQISWAALTWAQLLFEPEDYALALKVARENDASHNAAELKGLSVLESAERYAQILTHITAKEYLKAYPLLVEELQQKPGDAPASAYLLMASTDPALPNLTVEDTVKGFEKTLAKKTMKANQKDEAIITFLTNLGYNLKLREAYALAVETYTYLLLHYLTASSERQAETYENKAKSLEAQGLDMEKYETLKQGSLLNPDSHRLHNELGVVYYVRDKNYSQALEHFIRASILDAGEPQYFSNAGDAYTQLGQYQEAMDHYEMAGQLVDSKYPDWDEASRNRSKAGFIAKEGLCQYNFGQYSQALSSFEKAMELDPANVNHMLNKGNSLYYLGQSFRESSPKNYRHHLEQAVNEYRRALAINPANEPFKEWLKQVEQELKTAA